MFERLPQGRVKPALALSLHSTRAARARSLLPRAPRIAPDELVARSLAYARATGYPLQVQWTLLDGINDGADEIDGLVRLLAGRYAVLNLIPYNRVEGLAFAPPGLGARRRDGAHAAPPRRADQAAPLGRPGRAKAAAASCARARPQARGAGDRAAARGPAHEPSVLPSRQAAAAGAGCIGLARPGAEGQGDWLERLNAAAVPPRTKPWFEMPVFNGFAGRLRLAHGALERPVRRAVAWTPGRLSPW